MLFEVLLGLIVTLLSCLCPQGTSVLSPVLHIGSVIILAVMIYKKSAVQLFEKHPCLYILAFGFVSSKITNKLVVSSASGCLFRHRGGCCVAPALTCWQHRRQLRFQLWPRQDEQPLLMKA